MRYHQKGGLTLLAGALAVALAPQEAWAFALGGAEDDQARDERGATGAPRGEEEECQCPTPGEGKLGAEKGYQLGPLTPSGKRGAAFGAGLGVVPPKGARGERPHGVPPSTGVGGHESDLGKKPYALSPLESAEGASCARFGVGLGRGEGAPYTLGPIGGSREGE
jgi:hypothetical protein